LRIPTGVPLVYEFNAQLEPISRYYQGDPEEIRRAQEAVAKQGQAKG
jgi:2,3-bisphosphoglycerate-dependent phosphoglycerate mutase